MQKASLVKNRLFTAVFIAIFPVVFIVLELFLRFVHAGVDTRPFIHPPHYPQVYIDNVEFLNKYHSTPVSLNPGYVKNIFPTVKSKGVLRGFIIGESTPEGFPYKSNHAFARIAEMALKEAGGRVEIYNLGFSAMSSYYVKDAARKVLRYQPDFIIIYAGHNDFYGTISHTTGGNYLAKSLYLALKELRIFQLGFTLLQPRKAAGDNLMRRQYGGKRVPADPGIDREAAMNFMANIKSVLRLYSKKNIPVLVFEPVCNLLDMPPFSGRDDEKLRDLIVRYRDAIASGDRAGIENMSRLCRENQAAVSNAQIAYLEARRVLLLEKRLDMQAFIRAKDMDTTPFRARSALTGLLEKTAACGRYKNLFYIPTFSILTNRYGSSATDNTTFIDHLHFNREGHYRMAEILADELCKVFHFGRETRQKAASFCADREQADGKLFVTPWNRIYPYIAVSGMVTEAPFGDMLIPYPAVSARSVFRNHPLLSDPLVVQAMRQANPEDAVINALIGRYQALDDLENLYTNYKSAQLISPGSFSANANLGDFYSQVESPQEDPLPYLTRAYLLSGKKANVYGFIVNYLKASHRLMDLETFYQEQGRRRVIPD